MKTLLLVLLSYFINSNTFGASKYPADWWRNIPEDEAYHWEILPQDAGPGEVILSKRTELGVFSNLSFSTFTLDGESYNSIEGLWQMMKYPESSEDPRSKLTGWTYSRQEVSQLYGMKAKKAGKEANKILRNSDIDWISYQTSRFNYKDLASGSEFHFEIINRAIWNKVMQNEEIKELLLKTGNLKLRPDHRIKSSSPNSYFYHKILMNIREVISRE